MSTPGDLPFELDPATEIIPLPFDHADDDAPARFYPLGLSVYPHSGSREQTWTLHRLLWGGVHHAIQWTSWDGKKRAWKAEDDEWTEWVPMNERLPS